ncbi:hypothetical protein D3C78_758290 [compost metagenome]
MFQSFGFNTFNFLSHCSNISYFVSVLFVLVSEFHFSFFVSFESFFQSYFNNFAIGHCELNVLAVLNFVFRNCRNLVSFVESVSCNYCLGASSVSLVVNTFCKVATVDCCLNITFSPVRSTVVSFCWNFKFQCANKNCCQFLNCYIAAWVKQFLLSIFTFEDALLSSSFDVSTCPVFCIVLIVVRSCVHWIKIDRFNNYFSKFCTSNKFVKTCGTIWVTSKDTSVFQYVELSFW